MICVLLLMPYLPYVHSLGAMEVLHKLCLDVEFKLWLVFLLLSFINWLGSFPSRLMLSSHLHFKLLCIFFSFVCGFWNGSFIFSFSHCEMYSFLCLLAILAFTSSIFLSYASLVLLLGISSFLRFESILGRVFITVWELNALNNIFKNDRVTLSSVGFSNSPHLSLTCPLIIFFLK